MPGVTKAWRFLSSDEDVQECKAILDDEKPAESSDAPKDAKEGKKLDEPKEPLA